MYNADDATHNYTDLAWVGVVHAPITAVSSYWPKDCCIPHWTCIDAYWLEQRFTAGVFLQCGP